MLELEYTGKALPSYLSRSISRITNSIAGGDERGRSNF
jgi:hypothetical protein